MYAVVGDLEQPYLVLRVSLSRFFVQDGTFQSDHIQKLQRKRPENNVAQETKSTGTLIKFLKVYREDESHVQSLQVKSVT